MKKIKNFMLFMVIVSFGLLALHTNNFDIRKATTDSGFDSSWDSGGSSWDSGSSSWDSSSGGPGYLGEEDAMVILVTIIVFAIVLVAIKLINQVGSTSNSTSISKPNRRMYVDDKIKEYGIDENKMIETAYSTYVDIQNAWMDNDINRVKDKLSDELFNTYKMQLLTLKRNNQCNVMSDFNFISGYIYDIDDSNNKLSISVYLNVNCKDYLIDKSSEKVLRGNKNKVWDYEYTIDYLITKDMKDVLNKCPNCGAGLDEEAGARIICPYCRTLLVRNSPNLVMTRKHMNRQR